MNPPKRGRWNWNMKSAQTGKGSESENGQDGLKGGGWGWHGLTAHSFVSGLEHGGPLVHDGTAYPPGWKIYRLQAAYGSRSSNVHLLLKKYSLVYLHKRNCTMCSSLTLCSVILVGEINKNRYWHYFLSVYFCPSSWLEHLQILQAGWRIYRYSQFT